MATPLPCRSWLIVLWVIANAAAGGSGPAAGAAAVAAVAAFVPPAVAMEAVLVLLLPTALMRAGCSEYVRECAPPSCA